MLATTLFSLLALLVAIRWAGGRERVFMRDIMAPEVDDGDDLRGRARRPRRGPQGQARGRQDARKGVSRRREKHVLRAARDLAADLAAAGGEDTPSVEHSRREIARLRAA